MRCRECGVDIEPGCEWTQTWFTLTKGGVPDFGCHLSWERTFDYYCGPCGESYTRHEAARSQWFNEHADRLAREYFAREPR